MKNSNSLNSVLDAIYDAPVTAPVTATATITDATATDATATDATDATDATATVATTAIFPLSDQSIQAQYMRGELGVKEMCLAIYAKYNAKDAVENRRKANDKIKLIVGHENRQSFGFLSNMYAVYMGTPYSTPNAAKLPEVEQYAVAAPVAPVFDLSKVSDPNYAIEFGVSMGTFAVELGKWNDEKNVFDTAQKAVLAQKNIEITAKTFYAMVNAISKFNSLAESLGLPLVETPTKPQLVADFEATKAVETPIVEAVETVETV